MDISEIWITNNSENIHKLIKTWFDRTFKSLNDKCHGNHMVPSRANLALQAAWNWIKQSLKRAARSTSIFVNEGSALEVLQEAGAQ